MLQRIKNIISIVLLVFYLAGFCGIHLLKHSCPTCDYSEMSISINSDTSCTNCCCKENKKSTNTYIVHSDHNVCCDFDLVYLKTNPTTVITKANKAPIASETVLFTSQTINSQIIFAPERYLHEFEDSNSDRNKRIKPEVLCCFIC